MSIEIIRGFTLINRGKSKVANILIENYRMKKLMM